MEIKSGYYGNRDKILRVVKRVKIFCVYLYDIYDVHFFSNY